MNQLKIDLSNCYGIGKLDHTFDFSKSNSYLIYAPNGTMKSSVLAPIMLAKFKEVNNSCPLPH